MNLIRYLEHLVAKTARAAWPVVKYYNAQVRASVGEAGMGAGAAAQAARAHASRSSAGRAPPIRSARAA